MKLKNSIVVLIVILCFLLNAACAINRSADNTHGTENNSSSNISGNDEKKPLTVTFLKNNDSDLKGLEEIFKNYEGKSGNRVEMQSLPGGNEYEVIIKTRFATNDFPDMFFYYAGRMHPASLDAENNLYELTNESYVQDFTNEIKEFQTIKGKVWGIPWGSFSSMGVIYNREVFKRVGVDAPKNYQDFIRICEKIKSAGITPISEAVRDGWPCQIFPLAAWESFVTPAIGEDGIEKLKKNELKFSQIAELKDILHKYTELKTKGFMDEYMMSNTFTMQQEAVAKGSAAMAFAIGSVVNEIKQRFGEATAKRLGAFPVPSDEDAGTCALYAPTQIFISKKGTGLEAAKEVARFMTQPEQLKIWYDNNPGIPCYKNIKVELYPAQEDMNKYIERGKTGMQLQFKLEASIQGFDKICQALIIDGNVDSAVNAMEKNYIQECRDKKIPGF